MLGLQTAWLYVVGSLGFLYVDVQEFFTFTTDVTLRVNIACSMFVSPKQAPPSQTPHTCPPALLPALAGYISPPSPVYQPAISQ